MSESNINIPHEKLTNYIKDIFDAVGLKPADSKDIAESLVLADLKGVSSHGVSRVEIYVERIEKGLISKTSNIEKKKETSVSTLIDGKNGHGITVAKKSMEIAVEKALKHGVGIVGVNNSNHCGMLAQYTQYAAKNNCIALATTNAPPNMAPWGGRERFFGTNPFSYGLPTGDSEKSIIFDTATSVVARGKIILAARNKQKIPIGWAISKEGKPTDDPEEALEGLVLPVGGAKGSGLALMVDALSGLFTGANYGPHISDLYTDLTEQQNIGHLFIVMKADLFRDLQDYKNNIDKMIDEIGKVPVIEGFDKIYLPGEIENNNIEFHKKNGLPIARNLLDNIRKIADKYNIPNPLN